MRKTPLSLGRTFAFGELKAAQLAVIRLAAMVTLPEEQSVDQSIRPLPDAVQMPAPCMSGQCLIGPGLLTEEAGHKDVEDLVNGYPELMKIMP